MASLDVALLHFDLESAPHLADYRIYDYNLNRITGLLTVSKGNASFEFDCVVAPERKF
jgi:hypothetical protein